MHQYINAHLNSFIFCMQSALPWFLLVVLDRCVFPLLWPLWCGPRSLGGEGDFIFFFLVLIFWWEWFIVLDCTGFNLIFLVLVSWPFRLIYSLFFYLLFGGLNDWPKKKKKPIIEKVIGEKFMCISKEQEWIKTPLVHTQSMLLLLETGPINNNVTIFYGIAKWLQKVALFKEKLWSPQRMLKTDWNEKANGSFFFTHVAKEKVGSKITKGTNRESRRPHVLLVCFRLCTRGTQHAWDLLSIYQICFCLHPFLLWATEERSFYWLFCQWVDEM